MVNVEQIEYGGWPTCYRLANGLVELIVTADVGPRVIRFGFVDGENELCEIPDHMGKTGGDEFRLYGGHRLWAAPEVEARTYYPDNNPVSVEQHGDFVRFTPPLETSTGLQKEIDIYLADDAAEVKLAHRVYNQTVWPLELAPWALTVMTTGGTGIIPLPPRGTHPEDLLPANTMTFWTYTDMADPRWTWGRKYVLLRQNPDMPDPQKVGVMTPDGWIAYANHNNLFVKTFLYAEGAQYPDWGCSVETFTNDFMLEIETLGPLMTLPPDDAVEHVENWFLHRDVPAPQSDADVDTHILPKITGG